MKAKNDIMEAEMKLTDEEKLFLLQLLDAVNVKGIAHNEMKVAIMKKLDIAES